MSYALPMDLDDVSRRLLAARRVAGPVPGKEVRQGADREVGQFAGDGARGDGFAAQSPKVEAGNGAEFSARADLSNQAESRPATHGVGADLQHSELEHLNVAAESRSGEAAHAGRGNGASGSIGHANWNRGVARPNSPRKLAASLVGRVEAGRVTAAEATAEARFIVRLVNLGQMTQERARALIVVPEGIEGELQAFAALNPVDAPPILAALKFRRRVLVEFERLCAAAVCSASSAADRAPEGGRCAAVGPSAEELGFDGSPPEERILQPSADAGVA